MGNIGRLSSLTEAEAIHTENLQKLIDSGSEWAWWAKESLAIIRRLDARVGEAERDFTYAEAGGRRAKQGEVDTLTRERDALRAVAKAIYIGAGCYCSQDNTCDLHLQVVAALRPYGDERERQARIEIDKLASAVLALEDEQARLKTLCGHLADERNTLQTNLKVCGEAMEELADDLGVAAAWLRNNGQEPEGLRLRARVALLRGILTTLDHAVPNWRKGNG